MLHILELEIMWMLEEKRKICLNILWDSKIKYLFLELTMASKGFASVTDLKDSLRLTESLKRIDVQETLEVA